MKQFARIEGDRVVELLAAEELPPFHSDLVWMECSESVRVSWRLVRGGFLPPESDPNELASAERGWRDAAIEGVKWLRERHRDQVDIGVATTLTDERFRELLVYIQALRDWPQASDFPGQGHRPVAPDWIADQTE